MAHRGTTLPLPFSLNYYLHSPLLLTFNGEITWKTGYILQHIYTRGAQILWRQVVWAINFVPPCLTFFWILMSPFWRLEFGSGS